MLMAESLGTEGSILNSEILSQKVGNGKRERKEANDWVSCISAECFGILYVEIAITSNYPFSIVKLL